MPVYLILSFDVSNPEAYGSYLNQVGPVLMSFGAEVLVVDSAAVSLEGQGRAMNVVLKFEDEAKAMTFYNSPEYSPLKQTRMGSTTSITCVLAHSFVMPS